MKPKGWRNESRRHSLASKGIKTAQKVNMQKINSMKKTSNVWKKNGLSIPSADKVSFYAIESKDMIVPVYKEDMGKGWYTLVVGDVVQKTRNPDPMQILRMNYGSPKSISLFSETSYHSGINNPNKIKNYGTEDYTLDFSSYKPIKTMKLVEPVKSNLKKKFGKTINKVELQTWDYIVIDWIPDDKIKLQLKHTRSAPLDKAGEGKVVFKSKRFPVSNKKEVISMFKKYIKDFEKKR